MISRTTYYFYYHYYFIIKYYQSFMFKNLCQRGGEKYEILWIDVQAYLKPFQTSFSRKCFQPLTIFCKKLQLGKISLILQKFDKVPIESRYSHRVKSFQIWNFFWSVFSLFSPNTGKYGPE